jgi:CheY-like chemotaxis protein
VKNDIANLQILLVEDDSLNQLLFSQLLEGRKAKVKVAENGKVAIEMLNTEKFDIILMDINMPIMDGFEAIRIIRSTVEFKDYKIIAITANDDKRKCLEAGADSYIAKPCKIENIKNEILKLINS